MWKRGEWIVPSTVAAGLIIWACAEGATEQVTYDFSPENFDSPTMIDNVWWPHPPGTQFIYDGITVEDGEEIEHRIVITFTDLTKVIGGVNSVVVWEQDISDGEVVEAELAFRAQDNDGNVWHLGEYSEVYEDGELVGGRTWLVGHLEGARAGVMMQGDPQPGTPAFSEGFAPPPVNWTDFGRVREIGLSNEVEHGAFDDVVVIEEFNEEEPGAIQLKYYARGTGLIRVGWAGDDTTQEELELVDVIQLTPEQLAEERAAALALETRAYVYGQTPPAQQRTDTGGS
jgi:hypothetical protein